VPPRRVPLTRTVAALLLLATPLAACTTTVSGHGAASRSRAPSPSPSSTTTTPAGNTGESTDATASDPTQPVAHFGTCDKILRLSNLPPGRGSKLEFGCAQIEVPLNYADPGGSKITLQLIKVHYRDDRDPIGSLLTNPGGPGASGLIDAANLAFAVDDKLIEHFDLVGFDPRGVALSTPIVCLTDAQKDTLAGQDPDLLTAAGFRAAKKSAAQVARSCTAKYGTDLAHFNTVETAHDMDQIRQAVGDDRMNYLGFSYGTELGAAYAHLFPDRIRAFVLDGAVDPLTSDIDSATSQIKAFEAAFDQFATWCRSHSPCSTLGDPRQAAYGLVATAKRTPIASSRPGETRKATAGYVLTAVLQAMYSQPEWTTLAQAIIDGRRGDSRTLFQLADEYNERSGDGTYTNIEDANTAISCNDAEPGPSDSTVRKVARSWTWRFPLFGAWFASGLFTCQEWQPRRTPPPKPTAPTPTKVLVVGNLHDPATPYRGALDLAKTMGNAEVLTWNGEGHTSYLQGSPCVDDHVNGYLITTKLPPAGTTCPPK
jgi:pimeloyl-ACP methyl ester carboxylesterase